MTAWVLYFSFCGHAAAPILSHCGASVTALISSPRHTNTEKKWIEGKGQSVTDSCSLEEWGYKVNSCVMTRYQRILYLNRTECKGYTLLTAVKSISIPSAFMLDPMQANRVHCQSSCHSVSMVYVKNSNIISAAFEGALWNFKDVKISSNQSLLNKNSQLRLLHHTKQEPAPQGWYNNK